MTTWADLSRIFLGIGHIDMVFANAGITETVPFLEDELPVDGVGMLLEPTYPILDLNLRAVLNVIRLSWSIMKRQSEGGSIVLTASLAAYASVIGYPLYSASKAAVSRPSQPFFTGWHYSFPTMLILPLPQLIALVRSLRPLTPAANITLNAVAPSMTSTPLVPQELVDAFVANHLPVGTADSVALALVYSATVKQSRRFDAYGLEKDDAEDVGESRWNGRVIVTSGDRYMEAEGPLAASRPVWLGEESDRLVGAQLAATGF